LLLTVGLAGNLLAGCGSSATPAPASTPAQSGTTSNTDGGDGYQEATIRLAYNLPQDHHISRGIEDFAKKVTERSGGKVKVQVYP
ncbi:hypothetical protein MXD63_45490, partial [Frankia sp. Cpl3]|nr:hypothetical protein [Frankia sp. Cpl3]